MLPIVLGTYVTQPLLLVLAETPKASAPDRFRTRRRQRDLTQILFMGVGTINVARSAVNCCGTPAGIS